jgi:tight adherence protein B
MLLAAALGLVLVGVALLAASVMARTNTRVEREKRTSLIAGAKSAQPKKSDAFGGLLKAKSNPFDARVRAIFTIGMKRTWGMRSGSLTLLLSAATAAGAVWNLTFQVFGFPYWLATAAYLAASFLVPRFVLSREQKKTELKFAENFPDAIDTMSRLVRAGLPISSAVRTVALEAPPPVSTVFAAIGDQVRIGVPIEEVMNDSSATVGLPDFRFFTIAVGLQHETGGNLTLALENLSDLMRKRRASRLKAKAATGEIRMTAYTLAAVPVFTVGALLAIQPAYLVPLFADPRGHFILASAAGCLAAAFVSMRALMRRLTTD